MRNTNETFRRQNENWSRQEYALLGAFAVGCAIFVMSFAYMLGFGRGDNQTETANLIPPATIGERVPVIIPTR
jgi:hypothetical protein